MVLDFGLLGGLFNASEFTGEGFGADPQQVVWNDVGVGIVPIGAVVAWLKTMAGTPALLPSFVECNGQVLTDSDSIYNGATIPNLNGNINVLKGNATSGGLTSEDYLPNHTHTSSLMTSTTGGVCDKSCSSGLTTAGTSTKFYNVVWIMRIK